MLRSFASVRSTCGWSGLLVLLCLLPACNREPPGFYPFTPDLTWHYQLSTTIGDETTQQTYIVSNRPSLRWEDRTVHVRRLPDGTRWYYLETGDGVYRIATQTPVQPEPVPVARDSRTVLAYPLRRGQSWFTNSETQTLNKSPEIQQSVFRLIVPVTLKHTIESLNDTITVTAGTYDGCLRVQGYGKAATRPRDDMGETLIEVETTDWYAPGVGLVKSIRRETSNDAAIVGGEVRFELEMLTR